MNLLGTIKDYCQIILDRYHWGLVPFWAKDTAIGYKMINARMPGIFRL